MLRKISVLLVLLALLAVSLPLAAQEVVVDGLVNPRGLTFDSDGNLYVVEAGNGGDFEVAGGRAPIAVGASGQVTMISPEGDRDVIILGLPSQTIGNSRGASDILVTDDAIWLALGETPTIFPFSMGLVELSRDTLRIRNFVDLYSIEAAENPDGDVIGSNPVDFAVAADGTVFVADATCNCLFSWTAADGAQVSLSWPLGDMSPVPTTVDIGPDGDVYVGFLSGFPFPEGGATIERWSGGELVETFAGLTAVTDVLVTDDGTVYAVEFGVFNQGWGPGRVVMVTVDGPQTVLGELTTPYALAMDGDGNLFVTTHSSGGEGGQVVAVGM